jgi:hypothetical protein
MYKGVPYKAATGLFRVILARFERLCYAVRRRRPELFLEGFVIFRTADLTCYW